MLVPAHGSLHSASQSGSDAIAVDPNAPEVTLEGKKKRVFEDVLEVCSSSPALLTLIVNAPQLFCSRPTIEIFEHSWRPDAIFEVRFPLEINIHT